MPAPPSSPPSTPMTDLTLRAVLDATGDGAWYFDFREGLVHYNDAWYRMLGYAPGEIALDPGGWLSLVHPEDLPQVQVEMDAHLAGRTERFRSEHRLRRKSGDWLWVLDRGRVLVRDEEGRPLVAAGTHIDITAQKDTQTALLAAEARFRTLAELAPVGIFLADASGCVFANEAWSRITGWPLSEALGLRWAQAIHPEDREKARAAWEQAARTGRGFDTESRYLTPSGEVRWGFVQVRPYPGRDGFVGVVTDRTERRAAEEALNQRLKQLTDLKSALDQSAIVAMTDAQGVILEANAKFTDISGYALEELVGRTHRMVKSGHHDRAFFEGMWRTIGQGKVWHGEIQNRAKDGHAYWVDTTITPFLGEDGRPHRYLAIRFDVSERHRAEQELEQARQFLAHAMESVPGAFGILDAEDRLVLCNPMALELLPDGLRDGALGSTYADLLPHLLERQSGHSGSALQPLLASWLAMHRTPGARMILPTRDGRVLRVDERLTEDGWLVVMGTDITGEARHEESLTQAYLEAESANADKDQFIAAIGHELRAPLQAMLGNAELLLLAKSQPLAPSHLKHVKTILECGERQSRLINELLDLARLESGRMSLHVGTVDLRPLIESVLEAVALEADKRQVRLLLGSAAGQVRADSQRLDEVLLNLATNAVKYNRVEGHVVFRSFPVAEGWIRIEVEDSGVGIPLNQQRHVFEAYNRLGRDAGSSKGTGLGLSLARKLMEAMGGRIGFRSVPDEGTTFWVELPSA